jgi:TPR repeat protein
MSKLEALPAKHQHGNLLHLRTYPMLRTLVLALGIFGLASDATAEEISEQLSIRRAPETLLLRGNMERCEQNDATACWLSGFAYSTGDGVEEDDFRAVDFYSKSCDLGNGVGCALLAGMHEFGHGTRKDIAQAIEYFGKSCDLREALGCEGYARLKP